MIKSSHITHSVSQFCYRLDLSLQYIRIHLVKSSRKHKEKGKKESKLCYLFFYKIIDHKLRPLCHIMYIIVRELLSRMAMWRKNEWKSRTSWVLWSFQMRSILSRIGGDQLTLSYFPFNILSFVLHRLIPAESVLFYENTIIALYTVIRRRIIHKIISSMRILIGSQFLSYYQTSI